MFRLLGSIIDELLGTFLFARKGRGRRRKTSKRTPRYD
jgi:hypothetical protein